MKHDPVTTPLCRVHTPLRSYWREFRILALPPLFFCLLVAGIALGWGWAATGGGIAGIGVGPRSLVTAPQSGRLEQAMVEPFQWVEAGEPLAILLPLDARTDLDLLQSELNLAQLQMQPSQAEQNAMDFERLRMEWLRTKSELAVARTRLHQAEADVRRNAPLHRDGLISDSEYELSLVTRDALGSEVAEKAVTVDQVKSRLDALEFIGVPGEGGAEGRDAGFPERLRNLEAQLDGQRRPLILTAPMSGLVQTLHRQPGEHVTQGEPLVTLQSDKSEFIVGYLRQPYPRDPRAGAFTRVTTRGTPPLTFLSEVTAVGAQVEVITNALAIVRQGALVDAGLPFRVRLPEHVALRPGEIVNIQLINSTNRFRWPGRLSLWNRPSPPQPQPGLDL